MEFAAEVAGDLILILASVIIGVVGTLWATWVTLRKGPL